jgi:hypothetical protein
MKGSCLELRKKNTFVHFADNYRYLLYRFIFICFRDLNLELFLFLLHTYSRVTQIAAVTNSFVVLVLQCEGANKGQKISRVKWK